MEFKSVPTEFKADQKQGVLEGYASAFGFKDAGDDIVERGAFAKTLSENSKRVKVLWQHSPFDPIGKPIEMLEDSRGLYTRSKIAPTTLGKDVLILAEEGVINELSIGFDTVKFSRDEESGTRHLLEVRLWEYSPVTWAMNEMAVLTGVKSAADLQPLLEQASRIRDLGLKEGRVLSSRNMTRLKTILEELQTILAEAEPDDPKALIARTEPTDTVTPVVTSEPPSVEPSTGSLDLLADIKNFRSFAAEQQLKNELRAFGRTLRGEA